jgi:formylglycine-generating enzyme required for sulfatase activity
VGPYPANWRESHRPPQDEQVERRAKYKKLYAGIDDRDEDSLPLPTIAAYEPPKPLTAARVEVAKLDRWPLSAEEAKTLQKSAGPAAMEIDLGSGVKMKFALVPAGRFLMGDAAGFADEQAVSAVAIDRPFYLGQFEVTNRQYAQFDPKHDNGYIEGRNKDRTNPGTPINGPDLPVVRISWNEAMAFCQWLSQKTGMTCTLPTESQWEWACRAGTDTSHSFGQYKPGINSVANISDQGIAGWNYGRSEPGYSDGAGFTAIGGRYAPNAWGLFDMHGNVAEWCLSVYRPYPYRADDGRDDPRAPGMKVVRGGSWNSTMKYAASASRWRYQLYHPVYDVGFRVLVEAKAGPAVVAAGGQ